MVLRNSFDCVLLKFVERNDKEFRPFFRQNVMERLRGVEREPAPGGDSTDRTPDPTLATEIAPTIERGRNLIAIMPPAAAPTST